MNDLDNYQLRYFWEISEAHEPKDTDKPHGGIEPIIREE